MSADAKVWFEPGDDRGYGLWHGHLDPDYNISDANLHRVIISIEEKAIPFIYWYPRAYPDGQAGLVGYGYPRKNWEG